MATTPTTRYDNPALPAMDLIGIVSFAGHAVIQLPLVPVNDSEALLAIGRINDEPVGGSTNITAAIRCAARMLAPLPPHMPKKILLLADGEPNIETEVLQPTVAMLRHARIRLDCVGLGDCEANRLLRGLCELTAEGRFWDARTYDREARATLTDRLKAQNHRVRAATVLCLDYSNSMWGNLDADSIRMDLCQQAAFTHLALARQSVAHREEPDLTVGAW